MITNNVSYVCPTLNQDLSLLYKTNSYSYIKIHSGSFRNLNLRTILPPVRSHFVRTSTALISCCEQCSCRGVSAFTWLNQFLSSCSLFGILNSDFFSLFNEGYLLNGLFLFSHGLKKFCFSRAFHNRAEAWALHV